MFRDSTPAISVKVAQLRAWIPRHLGVLVRIFASLRERNYRLYFTGQCISLCGTWIQNIAMGWLVYRLTDSVLLLTTVTFLNLIPSLILAPLSGVLSDRLNRYKTLICTQSLYMLQATILAVLTLTGVVQVWQVLALSLFAGVLSAIEAPTRQAFYSKLVPAKDMGNAVALNSVAINSSRFIGPPIGGLLIVWVGEGYCFLINALSYIAVLVALLAMHLPAYRPKTTQNHFLLELKEGVTYIYRSRPLKMVILLIAAFSLFGLPFMSVLPAVVKDQLGGDSRMLGYMYSAIGSGALIAACYLAARQRVRGLGRVVSISGALFGAGVAVISLLQLPWLVFLLCIPVGFGMIATAAGCNTLMQTMVEDDKRGRVMSFYTMACFGMNPLGSLAVGALAKYVGLNVVLFGCGIACVVATLIYERHRPATGQQPHDPKKEQEILPEIALGIGQSESSIPN